MNADLLYTHAEIVIALAGFAGIVVSLRRPLSPVRRVRALGILLATIVQLLWAFVPIWLSPYFESVQELMLVSSRIALALTVVYSLWLLPAYARIGREAFVVFNLPVTIFGWSFLSVQFLAVTSNAFSWPWPPTFERYYLGMLIWLVMAVLTFTEAILRDEAD